jgi:dethiobiotin synthetase
LQTRLFTNSLAKSFFITATDTNCGKTFFTANLANALLERGHKVAVYKPVQSGSIPEHQDSLLGSDDLKAVGKLCPEATLKCSYCFELAATPALAANHGNQKISLEKIRADFVELNHGHDAVLVEGAGGLMVPLANNFLVIDLIQALQLNTLLIVPNKLGCINHACLSLEAMKQRKINCLGFVMNEIDESTDSEVKATNAKFISQHSGAKFLGSLSFQTNSSKSTRSEIQEILKEII